MSRPIGVTVVAIVMAVLGVFTLLLGLEGAGITNFGLKQLAPQGGLYANTVIVSGILTLIASFGLFTLARWAWYLAVIVLIIRVIADVFGLISSGLSNTYGSVTIASAAITIFFLGYFLRPNVRAAFGTEKAL